MLELSLGGEGNFRYWWHPQIGPDCCLIRSPTDSYLVRNEPQWEAGDDMNLPNFSAVVSGAPVKILPRKMVYKSYFILFYFSTSLSVSTPSSHLVQETQSTSVPTELLKRVGTCCQSRYFIAVLERSSCMLEHKPATLTDIPRLTFSFHSERIVF